MIASLSWLALHQDADGSWGPTSCCPDPGQAEHREGLTALSVLAFLGGGYSHLSRDIYDGRVFGDSVRRGLQRLLVPADGGRREMYGRALRAFALCEAYSLTGSSLFQEPARLAIEDLLAARNPGRGWRYTPRCGDSDSSVTGWAMMALASAKAGGLHVPREAFEDIRAWYAGATDPQTGRTGYLAADTGKVFIPSLNEAFEHHDTMTSLAALSRVFIDGARPQPLQIERVLGDRPRADPKAADFYAWYCGTMACFQFDGPKGRSWRSWSDALKAALAGRQHPRSAGCRRGSWEPADRWSGEGGRVYATAMNTLTLELLLRYSCAFGLTRSAE